MEECIHAPDVTGAVALELHDGGVWELSFEDIDDALQPVGGHRALHQQGRAGNDSRSFTGRGGWSRSSLCHDSAMRCGTQRCKFGCPQALARLSTKPAYENAF